MMGTRGPRRQGDETAGAIVAFDFDGTLTCRDSLRAFLAWRAGPIAYGLTMARLAPAGLAHLVRPDRGRLKAAMLRAFLAGTPASQLVDEALAFQQARSARLMRPDAVACWQDWRGRGARCVIVTASPDLLVSPFAEALGAEALIGTRLAQDSAGRITGDLDGANCRGPEKVTRLKARFGADIAVEAAYGDSAGDREMLAIARQKGMRVFRSRP